MSQLLNSMQRMVDYTNNDKRNLSKMIFLIDFFNDNILCEKVSYTNKI